MHKIIKNNLSSLNNLCRKYNVKTMHIFGSVCTDNFSDNSDIDILISFNELSIEEYTDNYFNLHNELEKLFDRKIDLLTERSIKNPYLLEGINKTRELIYAA